MLVPQKESGGQRVSQQQCTVPGTAQVEGAQLHAGSCVQAQPSPTLPRSGPAAGPLTAWSSLYRGLRPSPYLGSKGGRRGRAPCPSQDTQQPDFHPSPTSRRPIATQEHHGQGPSHQHRGSGEPQDPGGAGRAGALLRRTQMTGSRVACSSTERECRDAGSLAHSQERGFSVCPSQAVVRV